MPNLLIRDVPEKIRREIRRAHQRQLISQNAYLVSLLSDAIAARRGPSLFDEQHSGAETAAAAHGPHVDKAAFARLTPSTRIPFSFIDLFAGIGGMRLGLEAVGGRCRFSCEYDRHAQKTYHAWFGENPAGDVTELKGNGDVPQHDVLAAGFPCQPFSIAGVSKKNSLGREHGFRDRTQGTLFFHLATMIERLRPPVLLLENVKNLKSHNKGDTWRTIAETLDDLNYEIFSEVIDAAAWVPQHRERVIIVGFDRGVFGTDVPFAFPEPPSDRQPVLRDVLEDAPESRYTLTDALWKYLQDYAERHRQKGNGFGCSVADLDGITRTLSARYYKDGSEILIPQAHHQNPRRLTPREAGRLMGFPEHLVHQQVVSDSQAYKQFGNAVVPNVIQAVAEQIVQVMQWHLLNQNGCLLKR